LDNEGNIILGGIFNMKAEFGDTVLTGESGPGTDNRDAFIAKIQTNGQLRWASRYGSTEGMDMVTGFAVDTNNNILAVGSRSFARFLYKMNAEGDSTWSQILQSSSIIDPDISVCITDNDEIIVTGSFGHILTFADTTLTTGDFHEENLFLVKYNSAGARQWLTTEGAFHDIIKVRDISLDTSDNIVIAGSFNDTADFGGTQLSSNGYRDIFVGIWDTDGELLDILQAGDENLDEIQAITIDTPGGIFLTGEYNWRVVDGTRSSNVYLAKIVYDSSTSLFDEKAPQATHLYAKNFPNPFNNIMSIEFTITSYEYITIEIFGINGNKVDKIADSYHYPGSYIVQWNAHNYASGIYFYSLKSSNLQITKKCLLIK
jgi:hypothetical protein